MRKFNLFATAVAIALPVLSWAQPRAAACFFSAAFENVEDFQAWDLGVDVERRTPEGEGLGEFVPAWTIGNAAEANSAQYFPVVDQPFGNRFAMANDAAPPCNCDMADVMLTSPVIDLTGRSSVVLECRVFNEGILGAGVARIEATSDGENWQSITEIPALSDAWQQLYVDLSAFDGSSALRFRFRWGDGGNWAGGFAVDDVCLRERLANDLTITHVSVGDRTISPFTTGDQSLTYRQLPLEQAGPIQVTATLKNSGTAILRNLQASATLELNGTDHGPFTSSVIDSLAPGATVLAPITTGWSPTEAGGVNITSAATSDATDDDDGDNTATSALQLTTTGWDGGYSAMACDHGPAVGGVGGTGTFMVANRMEIVNSGSHAFGISVEFNPSTQVGTVVRALLMDGNFSFIDTSLRRTLSQVDIDGMWNGTPLYFSLSTSPTLEQGDVWVGLQRLGEGANVAVNVGGDVPLGRSVRLEGIGSTLSYLYAAPMVRLQLSEVAVGLSEGPTTEGEVRPYPNPANDVVHLVLPTGSDMTRGWTIVDASGRVVAMNAGQPRLADGLLTILVADLAQGSYTLILNGHMTQRTARMVIVR